MTQTFERLDVPPAYQLVFQAIETEIVEGRLNAGDRLPTETAMARQFGVNRSTVREGIRLLEQSGLVRREAGRRLHVSLPHTRELAPRVSRAMIMQRVTFQELWEVAMALEPAAAALAAVRISDSVLSRLEDNLEATRQAVAAGDPVVPLDVEFHALIAEAAGNKALLLCREPMSLLFYPAIRVLFTKSETGRIAQGRLIKAHEILLDALRGRDEKTAREWMTRHIVDFKRGYAVRGLEMDAAVDRLSLLAV